MIRWTSENDEKLLNIVKSESNITKGLEKAAEELGINFFAARNRWYTDSLRGLRGETNVVQAVVKPRNKRENKERSAVIRLVAAHNLINEAKVIYEEIENQVLELRSEIDKLKQENIEIKEAKQKLEANFKELEQEYNIIYHVINKARELTVKDQIGEKPDSQKFKMDRNGNLESVKERYWGLGDEEAVSV
jgi:chromosome segregation ATPase